MIRRTIKEHLDKERRFRPMGIKVLSLFFIDAVDKYRVYDAQGNALKGVYATIFEEEYRRWAGHPDYRDLFGSVALSAAAAEVHNGYVSIDKKKVGGKTVEMVKDTSGSTAADDDTYNLIMRDKEKLLGLDSPLKFIFSHSALKEGWDNPNVFQICNFSNRETERWRRQTIGRGLRLCVNQQGHRVRGFEVNTLTVVANESYQQFADNLQKEIEADGYQFGVVPDHLFAGVAVAQADGTQKPLGFELSKALTEHLRAAGMLDARGKVKDELRRAIKDGNLVLPPEVEAQRAQILELLRKISGRLEIKNADERRQVPVRRAMLDSPSSKTLGPHQVQDHVPGAVRQRAPDPRLHYRGDPSAARQQDAAAVAQGGHGDRRGRRDGGGAHGRRHGGAQRGRHRAARHPDRVAEPHPADAAQHRPHPGREPPPERLQAQPAAVHRDGGRGHQSLQARGAGGRHPLPATGRRGLLRAGVVRDRGADRLPEEHVVGRRAPVYQHVIYDSDIERDFAAQLSKNESIKVYAKLPGWSGRCPRRWAATTPTGRSW